MLREVPNLSTIPPSRLPPDAQGQRVRQPRLEMEIAGRLPIVCSVFASGVTSGVGFADVAVVYVPTHPRGMFTCAFHFGVDTLWIQHLRCA